MTGLYETSEGQKKVTYHIKKNQETGTSARAQMMEVTVVSYVVPIWIRIWISIWINMWLVSYTINDLCPSGENVDRITIKILISTLMLFGFKIMGKVKLPTTTTHNQAPWLNLPLGTYYFILAITAFCDGPRLCMDRLPSWQLSHGPSYENGELHSRTNTNVGSCRNGKLLYTGT